MLKWMLTHHSLALEGPGEGSGDGGELTEETLCTYQPTGSHLHGKNGYIDEGFILFCIHQENSKDQQGSKIKISHH